METLGQQLRHLRLQRGLTPDQISEETCIPVGIIRDLEDDHYGRFDSVVYLKSFLGNYSKFLGLDISDTLKQLGSDDINDPKGIFKGNRQTLDGTKPSKSGNESQLPVFLAPLLFGLLAFLAISLYFLFTKDTLPFVPKPANASLSEAGSVTPNRTAAPASTPTLRERSPQPLNDSLGKRSAALSSPKQFPGNANRGQVTGDFRSTIVVPLPDPPDSLPALLP